MSYNSLHKLVPCFSFSGAVTARCHCLTRADFCNSILGHFLGSRVRMVRKSGTELVHVGFVVDM